MMNQEREDVSMVEGELPVQQPTNSSMPNHLLPEAGAAQQANFTQAIEISKPNDTEGLKPDQAAAAQQQRNNKVGRNNSNDQTPVAPEELSSQYTYISKLGEGTYGVVYLAKELAGGAQVAVKEIKIDHSDDGIPSTAIREIAVLQELRDNPYIVNLKQIIHGGQARNRLFLIFEYFNQDMKKYLDKLQAPMPHDRVRSILYQLIKGTMHCHERRIMHRDLKPSNLLVNPEGTKIKIADFGLARTMGLPLKTYTHEVVTLWYRAPEVLLGSKIYSTAIDIWSIGAIFFELAHKKPLFAGDSEIGQIFRIFRTMGTPTEETW